MSNTNQLLLLGLCCLALVGQTAFAAVPGLSAASMTVPRGEPWLLYGTQLDVPQLSVFVAGNAAREFDAVASLQGHLAGTASLPEHPPEDVVKDSGCGSSEGQPSTTARSVTISG